MLGPTGPAEPGPFRTLSLGRALEAGSFALSANAWYLVRPAELAVSSPDPAGRTIDVVSRATVIDWRAALGIGRHVDLTMALPIYVDVRGAGSDAIATQKPPPIEGAAIGDPRIGVRVSLLPASILDWRLMLRNEWTLPLGNTDSYAGDVSFTSTTAFTGVWHSSGWSAAIDLGWRASRATRFGDLRLGTAAVLGAGFARDIVADNCLTVGVEAWANPVLVASPTSDVPNGKGVTTIPAEWLLNVQWHPDGLPAWFWLGGGSALPISHRDTSNAPFADSSFIAPSAARVRLGLGAGFMLGGT